MVKGDTVLIVYGIVGAIIILGLVVSHYYPNDSERITVVKVVPGDNEWIIVSDSGEAYYTNFQTYALVEVGKTYVGIVTNPIGMGKHIDHLVEVPP